MRTLTHILVDLAEICAIGAFVSFIALITPARADELEPFTPLFSFGWLWDKGAPFVLALGVIVFIFAAFPRKSKTQIVEPFADEADLGSQ